MKKSIRYLFCIAVLYNSLLSFAQENFKQGYIIKNNYDTLYGLLNLNSDYQNGYICTFKQAKDSNPQEFDPSQIRSYRFIDGKYYISKTIIVNSQKKEVFLEYLVNGYAKLFYFKDLFENYYFIQKDSSAFVPLVDKEVLTLNNFGESKTSYNKNFKEVLKIQFSDDRKIYPQIDKLKFDNNSLIKLSKQYHKDKCHNKDYIIYIEQIKSTWWLSPQVGYSYNVLRLKTSQDKAVQNTAVIGLQARKMPHGTISRWNSYCGIYFSKVNVKGDFSNTVVGDSYRRNFNISINSMVINIPLGFEYNILQKKISAGCYFGINNIFYVNPNYEVKQQNSGKWQSNFNKYNLGLNVKIDLRYSFTERSYIIFSAGYEYKRPIHNSNQVLDYINFRSIPVLLGYEQKLR